MRFPGYCTECRDFKQVKVAANKLAPMAARGGTTITGCCQQCERRAPRTEPSVNGAVAKTRLILKPLEK